MNILMAKVILSNNWTFSRKFSRKKCKRRTL